MTTAQLGNRIERVENDLTDIRDDLTGVKTEQARTTASVDAMRGDMSVLFEKLDHAISNADGREATKEMIPTKYVTWGIGLSITTLLAMIGVGLTVTGLAGGVILWAMDSGDTLQDLKSADRHELVIAKLGTLADDVVENRTMMETAEAVEATLERRIDALEAEAEAGEFRLAELEKDTAVHTEVNARFEQIAAKVDEMEVSDLAPRAELELLKQQIRDQNGIINMLRPRQ